MFPLLVLALAIGQFIRIWRVGARSSFFLNSKLGEGAILYPLGIALLSALVRFSLGDPVTLFTIPFIAAILSVAFVIIYTLGFIKGRISARKSDGIIGMRN